ncbi:MULTISPECIES: bacterioferritin [Moritella]|uniref:Bacterioferritin n=1 Tax=Moritella viscosa TaxID=80854 RepID=W6ANJ5_9GAMM|nr:MULTISPECIES: bacterioferritin [Moritella]AHI58926.1 putative bacterioferritin B [Moritella viscosa]QUM78844.1 bacterioferritin [Moritella sp. 5]QUM83050.1 bacterioferritin [Moritella sp. 28]QUM87351.1 bacterioferritin [Moritella sp. 36]CED62292.1 bacterioferritin [Moritella viscosa]
MQGNTNIIMLLNKALGCKLVAINQYFLHARMYKNWGLEGLDKADYKQSILKMKQADKLINRILFLQGLPNLQDLGRLAIGEEAAEMIQLNIELELSIRVVLQTLIEECEKSNDFVSRDIATEILEEVEEQIDWIESQQYLIGHEGLDNYLQSQCS